MAGTYSNFIKGMTTGLVLGAAVTIFADPLSDKQRHKLQKRTEGVFRNIGGMIDTALGMMH